MERKSALTKESITPAGEALRRARGKIDLWSRSKLTRSRWAVSGGEHVIIQSEKEQSNVFAVGFITETPYDAIGRALYRARYEETLLKAGYTVEARSSRTDALNWLSENTQSVAILDVYLKDGDGTEIALILPARDVPMIFCSGGSPRDLPEDFRAASWVHKPYMDGELLRAVSKARGTALSG